MKITSHSLPILLALGAGLVPASICAAQCYWMQQNPATSITPRGESGMAYDPVRNRTVLFGGYNNSSGTTFSDTWEWDGSTWSLRANSGRPGALRAAMAFDPITQQVLAYGGQSGGTQHDDTWLWNGTTWTLAAATGPGLAFASFSSVTLDPARQRLTLLRTSNTDLLEMWEWDGAAWSLRSTGGPPPGRYDTASDAGRGLIVTFGGPTNVPQTWEWNGVNASWTFRTSSGPMWRSGHQMVYATAAARTILFGGVASPSGFPRFRDTWTWDGNAWSLVSNGPPGAFDFAMSFDTAAQRAVLVGGLTQTWEFDPAATQPGLKFTTVPTGQVVAAGDTLHLSVAATGAGPLSYQWRHYDTPLVNGGRISGADTPDLAVSGVLFADAGWYDVVVTDSCGPVITDRAQIGVSGPCYPNCDGSTAPPILNANDFQCFLNQYAVGIPYGNCDGSTVAPVLNANDFQCFLNQYAAGCP